MDCGLADFVQDGVIASGCIVPGSDRDDCSKSGIDDKAMPRTRHQPKPIFHEPNSKRDEAGARDHASNHDKKKARML